MANHYDRQYGYGEQLPRDYRYHSEENYQGYQNPNWCEDQRFYHNEPRSDWSYENQGEYPYYEDQEPQYQQFSMPSNNGFHDEFSASFNPGGYPCYDDSEDFSHYQEPPPPPPQPEQNTFNLLLELKYELEDLNDTFSERKRSLMILEEQIAEVASAKASPYIPPLDEPIWVDIESENEKKSEKSEESELKSEKNEVVSEEVEKESDLREETSPSNTKPPLPYPIPSGDDEDMCLMQSIKHYSAHCGKEEIEAAKSPQELLNTPPDSPHLPSIHQVPMFKCLECESEEEDQDPSEACRYGRQQENPTRKAKRFGRRLKLKRRMSKLLQFPNYRKSRWKGTFEGTSTTTGLVLGINAKRRLPVPPKDDLQPP